MEMMTYKIPNILIVDDVNANLVILTEMIRNAGYIARPITTAQRALTSIEVLAPHLILLDISMPDINGFEFCTMLKKNPKTREIPIIFISALNSTEDKIRGFQLGAVDYIAKPFEIEEVTLRINTHLKIYKMQQELEVYNKRLYKIINEQIRKIYEEQKNVMFALTRLIERRDHTKESHLGRIGKNSRLLAMSMQLSPLFKDKINNSFIDTIELASQLLDIGKITISDKILLKPGKLSLQEQEIIRGHCEVGADTLKEIYYYNEHNKLIRMAIDIAWAHHENWDGTGYPRGLSRTEIPLCARIVSIVDVYDALISERSYKPAYSHEESIRIINEETEKKFDPDIVMILNKIHRQLRR
jgi:putative two-component system response regulator